LFWLPLSFLPINPFVIGELPELAARSQLSSLADHPAWAQDETVERLALGEHPLKVAASESQRWHAVDLPAFSRVVIAFTSAAPGGGTIGLEIVDPQGEVVSSTRGEDAAEAVFETKPAGTYYVQLTRAGPQEVAGTLVVSAEPPPQDPFEENDTLANAQPLSNGTYPELTCFDDDWFALQVRDGERLAVRIDFDGDLVDLELSLYDDREGLLGSSHSSLAYEQITFDPAASGTIYLRVHGASEQDGGRYALQIRKSPREAQAAVGERLSGVPLAPRDDRFEDNDTRETAHRAERGPFLRTLRALDDDWYAFQLSKGEWVEVTIRYDPASCELELSLFVDEGTLSSTTRFRRGLTSSGIRKDETIRHRALKDGTVFVRVRPRRGAGGEYVLEVSQ
jgi:hypothetical protein